MGLWGAGAIAAVFIALYGIVFRQRIRGNHRRKFTDALTHRITVQPDERGRPGETFMAPSLSPHLGVVAKNGTRNDCAVILSRQQSMLLVVCLRPAIEEPLAEDAALAAIHLPLLALGQLTSTVRR